jgi:pimeloyl-ACP methyl ester carboxylesterase
LNTRVMRPREWANPPAPVRREVLTADAGRSDFGAGGQVHQSGTEAGAAPPVLFVPGYGHGAWAYAEHWLEHAAERGFPAFAMSLRGQGNSGSAPGARLRDYVHDVTQVAAGLPRQAVLVGHGAGALVVAQALARYPARAGVLVAPVFGGPGAAFGLLRRNPAGTLPGLFGGAVRLRRGQLFSRELPSAQAQAYVARLGRVPGGALRQLVRRQEPEAPVGDPPVLVVGSPDDRVVAPAALDRVARRYGGAPLLFPGMGHDLMLDNRWREPIDAILDWLEKA